MKRWLLSQVRASMYAPLDLAYSLGLDVPRFVLRAVVAIDVPILAVLMPRNDGVSGS